MLMKRLTRRLTDEQRQMVADNLGCAKYVCHKMQNYIVLCQIEDPLEVCYLKMVECVPLYTPQKGKVSTFFCGVCRTALLAESRKRWEKCRAPGKIACSLDKTVGQDNNRPLREIKAFDADDHYRCMWGEYDPVRALLLREEINRVIDYLYSRPRTFRPLDRDIYLEHIIKGTTYEELGHRHGVSRQMAARRGKDVEKLVRERLTAGYES